MSRDLDFIVAMTREGVIGKDNALPWRLPQDLKRFRSITTGNSVIMGRKTFESIGKPLPARTNLVLTRDEGYRVPDGVIVCHSWDDVLAAVRGTPFVIGGAEIYRQALPRLRRLYLTLIHRNFEGDAFFPDLNLEKDFVLEEESETFEDPFPFQFQNWIHRSCLH